MAYVSLAEVRASAHAMTTDAVPSAPDDLVRDLIERASRMFDRECGVEDEYFESALHPVWESLHVYIVGDIVTPTTPNDHKYRVTTAGTSAASEPTWSTGSGATVISGSVIFTEYGADVVATEQIIYPDGTNYLRLPPYVAGTLDADITLPANYTVPQFIERNGYLVRSSEGVLASGFVRPFDDTWPVGVPITVTAKWGFEETPADVKAAVIELAINLWRETDPASLKLTNLDGSAVREGLPPRVKQIAKQWRHNGAAFV